MSIPNWTEPQRELMGIIYGDHGFWDPPCQHPGPVWTITAEGLGRCTMCPATWTMADENERAARIAAGPPEGESERDRMWREFREAAHASRPLIMPLPAGWKPDPVEPTGLEPDLAPYLDWPTDWEENEVWCHKNGCTIGACGEPDPGSRAWICSRYHLTARELLAGIKKHAEDA